MTAECPICNEEYKSMRVLTQGEHKHETNIIRKLGKKEEEYGYCIEYIAQTDTEGGKIKAKAYFHELEHT